MQTIFCTECGHKMVYAGAKPKFCSSCGVPMGNEERAPAPGLQEHSEKNTPSLRDQMQARLKGEEYHGDDETDIDYVPQLNKLEYEISDGGFGNLIHKFEDVVNVSTEEKPEEKTEKRRGRPRKKRQ